MLRQAMPALLLLGLVQATTPALARGLVPVCSATGTRWQQPGGGDAPDQVPGPCAHGWCSPRGPRQQKG